MAYVKDKARPDSIIDRAITGQGDSWKRLIEITPGSTIYNPRLQALICGTAGDVTIVNSNGDTVTHTVVAGQTIFEEIKQVTASDVTDLVGAS